MFFLSKLVGKFVSAKQKSNVYKKQFELIIHHSQEHILSKIPKKMRTCNISIKKNRIENRKKNKPVT